MAECATCKTWKSLTAYSKNIQKCIKFGIGTAVCTECVNSEHSRSSASVTLQTPMEQALSAATKLSSSGGTMATPMEQSQNMAQKRGRSGSTGSSSSTSTSEANRKKAKKRKKNKKKAITSSSSNSSSGSGSQVAKKAQVASESVVQPSDNPEVDAAKSAALQELLKINDLESKEVRAKAWRALLRQWHPDKNPEKREVALVVFQFLQKGKSLVSLD